MSISILKRHLEWAHMKQKLIVMGAFRLSPEVDFTKAQVLSDSLLYTK